MALAMLLGSIPFGYIALRLKMPRAAKEVGRDTCDLSMLGKGSAVAVCALSIIKGFIPVYIAGMKLSLQWAAAAAIIVVLSAAFPYWLMFKPSKAAGYTFLGTLLALLTHI